jgi:hypothetical protein
MVRVGQLKLGRRKVEIGSSCDMPKISNMRMGTLDKDVSSARNGRDLGFDCQSFCMNRYVIFIRQIMKSVAVVLGFVSMSLEKIWMISWWHIVRGRSIIFCLAVL